MVKLCFGLLAAVNPPKPLISPKCCVKNHTLKFTKDAIMSDYRMSPLTLGFSIKKAKMDDEGENEFVGEQVNEIVKGDPWLEVTRAR